MNVNQPLLNGEETEALLDAMRTGAGDAAPGVQDAALGSPDRSPRLALGAADRSAEEMAVAIRKTVIRLLGCSALCHDQPTEIVPSNVLLSSVAAGSSMMTLTAADRSTALLIVGPMLSGFVVNRRLGAPLAAGEGTRSPARDGLSAVDRRMVRPFMVAVATAFSRSWSGADDTFTFGETVGRTADLPELPQFEPLLRIGLRVSPAGLGNDEIIVALTPAAVRSTIPTPTQSKVETTPTDRLRMAGRIAATEIVLTVILGRARSTIRDVIKLAEGDVIRLDTVPDAPIEACVEGVPKLRGLPLVQHGNLAIELTESH